MSVINESDEQELSNKYKNSFFAIVILTSVLFRYAASLAPYSGKGDQPLFGDYEAQRHWQEVTISLPIRDWYQQTPDNDLQYWGLDYPPLTAYHSWIVGQIANYLNSSYVELGISRGIESPRHQYFMRQTVLFADIMLYLIPLSAYVLRFQCTKAMNGFQKATLLALQLFYAGQILIDHCHFQYNCISLGLYITSVWCLFENWHICSAIMFVLALNYKQMELYHALPIFFGLLSVAFRQPTFWQKLRKFISISLVTLGSFMVIWAPFIGLGKDSLLQVLRRIFPVKRGIFEDKVANFWCVSSVLFKWQKHFDKDQMLLFCAATVFCFSLPSCFIFLARGSKKQLLYCSMIVSLTFFIFSYQVHEKSVLLVAIPTIMALHHNSFACVWLLHVSIISLHPLVCKDGIRLPFYALYIAYSALTLPTITNVTIPKKRPSRLDQLKPLIFKLSLSTGLLLCLVSDVVKPPSRYPYIFPLLNCVFCFLHFLFFLFYFYYCQFVDRDVKRKED